MRHASSRGRWLAAAAALILPAAAFGQTATAQTSRNSAADRISSLVDSLAQVRTPVTAAISPDGNYIAWAYKNAVGSELHLTGIAPPGGAQDGAWDRVISPDTIRDITRSRPGDCTASHPAWSPNGDQLAFLSNCGAEADPFKPAKQENLWLWTPASNEIRQISHLHGAVSDLNWSPDGRSIAFLYVENATRPAGAVDAMKPWSGVIGEDNVEIQRVYAIDVTNRRGEWVTPQRLHVYEFSWSADSHTIIFIAADPPGENNWWTAKLYEQTVLRQDGQVPEHFEFLLPTLLLDPTKTSGPLHNLQIAVPRFSPDGKQIAFIGGLMSDQGSIGGDIYLIPTEVSAEPRNLTPNRTTSPAWITWLDNTTLGVSEHTGGSSHITAIDTRTGKDDPAINLTLPETIIAGFDVMSISTSAPQNGSKTANVTMIRQSYTRPPEVWAGPLNDMKQLTHLNDRLKPQWGKAESVEWTNDGFHLQGWLLYPANYDPAQKYPLLVQVHGGPSAEVTPRWPEPTYGAVPFSTLGYFVFLPNPRGSFGQGEKFTQANIKDFGHGDLRDILAGMDTLEKRLPIDPNREGITGWSYGGFMTMFAVTQTTRFKAAVAGAGISNWQSYYGENSIDQWMLPFFGANVYDDPAVYAKSSPINFIKHAKTPTLVVVGDRDGECPAPQSFEFWHALREEGVKTQLVIYPNEGHHFVDPEHRSDVLRRALEWFESQMPAGVSQSAP